MSTINIELINNKSDSHDITKDNLKSLNSFIVPTDDIQIDLTNTDDDIQIDLTNTDDDDIQIDLTNFNNNFSPRRSLGKTLSRQLSELSNDGFDELNRSKSLRVIGDVEKIEFLSEKIKKFIHKRELSKIKQFNKIFHYSWLTILIGIILMVFIYFVRHSLFYIDRVIYIPLVCFSIFIITSGILSFSTIPISYCDFDYIIKNNKYLRIATSTFLFLLSIIVGTYPPYTGFISALLAIVLLFVDNFTLNLTRFLQLFLHFTWPVYLYLSFHASNPDNHVLVGNPLSTLHNNKLASMWLIVSVYIFITTIIFNIFYYKKYYLKVFSKYSDSSMMKIVNINDSSLLMYGLFGSIYFFTLIVSTSLIVQSICISYFDESALYTRLSFYAGITLSLPIIILIYFTPQGCFNIMVAYFDNQNQDKDGSFLANLADMKFRQPGQEYWVKLANKNVNFDIDNPRHHYIPGVIVDTDDDYFYVKTIDNTQPIVKLKNSNDSQSSIYSDAKKNLRCIDWNTLKNNKNLFVRSIRSQLNDNNVKTKEEIDAEENENKLKIEEFYALSFPVDEQTRIDFFISHSWADDGKEKFKQLEKFVSFLDNENPTFWFDKVCFEQSNISNNLKALPVNIFACDYFLILAGNSYSTRLWCIWELYTMISFMDMLSVVNRTIFISLDNEINFNNNEKKNILHKCRDNIISLFWKNYEEELFQQYANVELNNLTKINIKKCRCFDPNEENNLKYVITAGDTSLFERKIGMLAKQLMQKNVRKTTRKLTLRGSFSSVLKK